MTTWILVGNQSVAKLFTRETNVDAPTLIKQFEHPEGRLHRGDLVTDKGAAVFQSHGSGQQRTTTPRVSVSEQEARYFASELAEKLRLGRNEGQFQQLTLVCAPEFLGMLREAVDDATAKLINAEFTKNIADNPPHDVALTLQKLSQDADPPAFLDEVLVCTSTENSRFPYESVLAAVRNTIVRLSGKHICCPLTV